ncbi:MAG: hypothetical protein JWN14_4831 [Chthonomonadales bacterium]|nr:hypothetical protein [Chthonomonadales bacterium]
MWFVPEETLQQNGHVGLHSMRERIFLLGGSFHLQSKPGEGASIRAVVPALEAPSTERESVF